LIRNTDRGPVELQLRTSLQHQWAELSELLDRRRPGIKYGAGPADLQLLLDSLSAEIRGIEETVLDCYKMDTLGTHEEQEKVKSLQSQVKRAIADIRVATEES
jgi:ppGpp synthetase/RelA/SpoT-type nucleotidyltranferase